MNKKLYYGLILGFLLLALPGFALAKEQSARQTTQSANTTITHSAPTVSGAKLIPPAAGDPLKIALAYLQDNAAVLGLSASALENYRISDQYVSPKTGVTHIYLRQQYNNLDVYNAIININVTAEGQVLNVGNRFVPDLSQNVAGNNLRLSAEDAVLAAGKNLKIDMPANLVQLSSLNDPAQTTTFSGQGYALEDVTAQLVYFPLNDGSVRLAWDLAIYQLGAQNWWSMRIDATTGAVLGQNNFVVHDNWGHADNKHTPTEALSVESVASAPANTGSATPLLLNPDEYFVYPPPAESPNHTIPHDPPLSEDNRTLEVNPASANASPFGWHDTDGSAGPEWTITRGNNAHAYEDSGNNDTSIGNEPDGGSSLVFSFTLDLTQEPNTYVDAAITNLFYWNNIIHDVLYEYGFNEVSGNFQENNYGNGGLGSDYVYAEGQDGSGSCNANFGTPADGSNPRMQMYICGNTSPTRDGDLDNNVIIHEYGHGVSNRLTGGPGTTSCLNNSEQMGEGWSDYLALMMTMEPGDAGTDPRGMGTYLFGQPSTGPGIRLAPYSTDLNINNYTYQSISACGGSEHCVGFHWATMLWDMSWDLTDIYGFDPDIYSGTGGNNLALQLVMDGMKLQPCSPGFVDGRDAILAADQALTGGTNQCTIWKSFARRGLGYSADQGSSSSTSDGTEAFDIPPSCQFLEISPAEQNICVSSSAVYTVAVGEAFTTPVTLSANGHPAGTTATFNPNPVNTVPGSSNLTISNTIGAAPGNYSLMITGTDIITSATFSATLNVFDGTPGTPSLTIPGNGASGVSRKPALAWNVASQGYGYFVEIASDAGFSNVVYSATVAGTNHTVSNALTPLSTYYWRVMANNTCGDGAFSSPYSFTTLDTPPLLVVDDDDNTPDVQAEYTDILNTVGIDYDVWDTGASDSNEPGAGDLSAYEGVIWFTGNGFASGSTGPSATSETALSTWLDNGGCMLMSSQDWLWAKGGSGSDIATPLMSNYFGLATGNSDVNHTTATGTGAIFSGLGPYTLNYPYANYADDLTPDGTAALAFSGNQGVGNAAISKDDGTYKTTWLGFPFEALSSPSEREEVMTAFLDDCGFLTVPDISLTKTVGTDPNTCATTDNLIVEDGTEVTYCYLAENTGNITLTTHVVVDDQLGTIFSTTYNLAPGLSTWITESAIITQNTVNSATWTAGVSGSLFLPVSASDMATVSLGAPAISLSKTAGTGGLCTGDDITVAGPTNVTYCYTVTNNGNVSLNTHNLLDDQLGQLLSSAVYTLAPNASYTFSATELISATTVNSATWTAEEGSYLAQASDVATVTVVPVSYGVQFNPATSADSGDPGQTVVHTLWLSNTGNVADSYSLSISGTTWSASAPTMVGPVASGSQISVQVSITVPVSASGGDSDSLTLIATSQGDNGQQANANLSTSANNVYGVTVTPTTYAMSGLVGTSLTYTLWVSNTGNTTDTFSLSASGNWTATTSTSVGPLAAGNGASVSVMVAIPTTAIDAESDVTTFSAVSQGDAGEVAQAWLTSTATTVASYTLNITIVGTGTVSLQPSGGTVNISPASRTYLSGTVVSLSAIPAPSWVFSGWTGILSGTLNPQSILMDSDKSITATFSYQPKIYLPLVLK